MIWMAVPVGKGPAVSQSTAAPDGDSRSYYSVFVHKMQ